ncbi:MAG: undecaprenyl-diphosphate phosphatase [Planctomycetota bacterium]
MGWFEALILGVVQGLTEFLPVSSSGHLALGQILFGHQDPAKAMTFSVAVHVGSLAAVLVFVRAEIREMLTTHKRFIFVLGAATLPMVVAIPLRDTVRSFSTSALAVGLLLMFNASILWVVRRSRGGAQHEERLSYGKAFLVGWAQLLSILPGISRSGATIAAGLRLGLTRIDAVRFSFLMALPAIGGAFVFELMNGGMGRIEPIPTAVGATSSFLSSLFAMKVMVGVVERRKLGWFAGYCLLAGAVAIVAALANGH